jgi:predicted MFS family arabinose efflux permease
LVFGINEPEVRHGSKGRNPVQWDILARLSSRYWWIVGFGAVFTLARFSEAFLVLRAQRGGIPIALAPLVMVAMNMIYAGSAFPFGHLSDRMRHTRLLSFGLLVLFAAEIVLATEDHWSVVVMGVGLWGLHLGMTQGLLAAMIADAAPADLRGTAYGFFNLASGVAMLLASVVAGFLWDQFGASFTFYAGAAFSAIALAGLTIYQLRYEAQE